MSLLTHSWTSHENSWENNLGNGTFGCCSWCTHTITTFVKNWNAIHYFPLQEKKWKELKICMEMAELKLEEYVRSHTECSAAEKSEPEKVECAYKKR